jgi:hypothetical protein
MSKKTFFNLSTQQTLEWFKKISTVKFKIIVCLSVFIFSYWLIYRNNSFFSGDMGIIGTITDDFSQGKFYSWYFYGQNYFGNLEPLILSILTRISGNSIQSLYFWEHFWYFLTSVLLFLTLPKLKNWQTLISVFAFFFSIKYYDYLYYPQGFSFTLLVITVFYYIFQNIYTNQNQINNWIFFLVGLFTTLGLWFNPSISIIFPIFLIIYFYKLFLKELTLIFLNFVCGLIGLIIGIIPFIFGFIETKGLNVEWFFTNKSGNIFANISYFGADYIYFFSNQNRINISSTKDIILSTLLDLRVLFGVVSSFLILLFLIFSLKFWKEKLIAFLFLFFSSFLLLNKDLGQDPYLFKYIRYSIPSFTFILVIIFSSLNTLEKNKYSIVMNYLCTFIIIIFTCFGISRSYNLYINAASRPQTYEIVADKLINYYRAEGIFCDNYFDLCMSISYKNKATNFKVEMIDSGEKTSLRNPSTIGVVNKIWMNGGKVFSLVREDKLSSLCKVLEIFLNQPGSTKYYLIEGKYSDCKN